MCLFMCVLLYVTSNQSNSKKPQHALDFSKLDAWFHKTRIKVLRFDMCTSMISLSKIKCGAITQSSKETRQQNEQWGWRLEAAGKDGGWGFGQNLKKDE